MEAQRKLSGGRAWNHWGSGRQTLPRPPPSVMGMRVEERIWEDTELQSGSGNRPCPLPHPQVFSLIVFSSLLTDGYQNKTDNSQLHCVLNSNSAACSFAVGAGLLSFLSSLAFLALDAHEVRLSSTRFKTAFQLLDLILAGE